VSNAKREEKKYYQKLGVVPLSIDNIKKIIKTNIKNTLQCWKEGKNIDRQTFKVIGSAGIGKTEISIQLAKELSEELKVPFQHIIIKAPVLSRDDLLCPFPIVDNGRSRFKMLYSDFVPLDSESYGIFIIDELSRGDSSFQQLCWQIQNEQKVHTLPLPNIGG
jgi:predicted ATPase